jgi:transcriptional regulator GlxA family with amidase domain
VVHDGRIYTFAKTGCIERFKAEPERFLVNVSPFRAGPARAAPATRRNVAILIWERAELLDFTGPAEVFYAADHGRAFRVYTVARTLEPVRTQGSVLVKPEFTLEDCPKPDVLVVPGGSMTAVQRDPAVLAWVKQVATEAEVVLSVCTGAFLLAEVGLLDGSKATTHHASIAALKKAAPSATVVENRRFVDNGRIVTAGGVSAGIDGALHVVDRLVGREAARWTAEHWMEYRWKPSR